MATKGVDGSARHGDVLAVELADHIHASGVGVSGLEVLWFVDLRIHHVSRGNLAGGHANASGGLVVHGREGTWHHATVGRQEHGLSGRNATTTADTASHGDHTRGRGGVAADRDGANAASIHHGLRTLVALLDRHGDHGNGGGAGLEGNGDAMGSLCESYS